METVVFLFPLLNLPDYELDCVLGLMEPIDLIAFSLISEYTKYLARSFKLYPSWPHIRLDKTLNLEFGLRRYSAKFVLNKEPTEHNAELTGTDTIEVKQCTYDGTETSYQWTKPGFDLKDWVKHLNDVTHISNIKSIIFYPGSEIYNIHSVAKTIKAFGVSKLMVRRDCSDLYRQLISKTILTPRVLFHANPYPDRELFQKVLVSNYDTIDIVFGWTVSLEELLVVNSKYLTLNMPGILTMETLNKFLKIWRTGFNQKLKHIHVFEWHFVPDTSVILKGIDHDVVDRAVERSFTRPIEDRENTELMSGGYDIHGSQGMKATLFIDRPHSIELFFWD